MALNPQSKQISTHGVLIKRRTIIIGEEDSIDIVYIV